MNDVAFEEIDDRWIISKRPAKHQVDARRPYAYLIEKESSHEGKVEDIATIFLTNRECPFKCLMCDLWKNTTDNTVPEGAIQEQIQWALSKLPPAKHIKLYNSGNFFDSKAIPSADIPEIASQLRIFDSVVIENHPRLIDKKCLDFQSKLGGRLEVAIGLETSHPQILEKLNKHMTLEQFRGSVAYLTENNILVRAFVLLRPPFLNESEAVLWAKRSLEFAFDCGVECCVIIPTRSGNGALDYLAQHNKFAAPKIESLEEVLEFGINKNQGRVFADLWDVDNIMNCKHCRNSRKERLLNMNLSQKISEPVVCNECSLA